MDNQEKQVEKNVETALVEGQGALLSCESVVFCVDVSGSMSGKPLETLKKCFTEYIERKMLSATVGKDNTGLVCFPGKDSYSRPLSAHELEDEWDSDKFDTESGVSVAQVANNSSQTFRSSLCCDVVLGLSRASPKLVTALEHISSHGNTPMGDGYIRAGELLQAGASGLARIILMTDGDLNGGCLSKEEIITHAAMLAEVFGIITDTVGIIHHGGYGSHDSDIDVVFLKKVAEAGKGIYTQVDSWSDFARYLSGVESERRELLGHGILLLPGS